MSDEESQTVELAALLSTLHSKKMAQPQNTSTATTKQPVPRKLFKKGLFSKDCSLPFPLFSPASTLG